MGEEKRRSPKRIFRRASVEPSLSPEQFNDVLQVTSRRAWIALVAIGLLLVTAAAWGFAGRISTKVPGRGILVRSGGVLEVITPASGRVVDLAVQPGDSVSQGQVVVRLAQPDLSDELQEARGQLRAARGEYEQRAAFNAKEAELEARSLRREEADLQASIHARKEEMEWLSRRLEDQQQLLEKGLITSLAIQSTRQQYKQISERIRRDRSDLSRLALRRLESNNRGEEALRSSRVEVRQREAEVARLERELRSKTRITTPFSGRVLEIMTEQGDVMDRGGVVLRLERTGGETQQLVAILYLPSRYGKMVRTGMPIHIAPSTVRQEEFGMMIGKVSLVSDYPATPQGMLRVLKNDNLVQELSGDGAPYEIRAVLNPDPATPSRYRWSSSKGPPVRIESGTLATALVTLREQRPADLVLPLLNVWAGK